MHVVEFAEGATFEKAHEIPCSTLRPQSKSVGHKSSGNGMRKATNKISLPGRMAEELKKIDHETTLANRRVLVIEADGRRHWMLRSEYEAAREA